jgi:fatty acid desaturase
LKTQQKTVSSAWSAHYPGHSLDPAFPVPQKLNFLMLCLALSCGILSLYVASHSDFSITIIPCAIVFSFAMVTNYALLHEAVHSKLLVNPRFNHFFGTLTALFFPTSFHLLRKNHLGHHLRNRTDSEVFDLVLPGDNRLFKQVQWYLILLGFFYPFMILSVFFIGLFPIFVKKLQTSNLKSAASMLSDLDEFTLKNIRKDLVLGVCFWILLAFVLDLRLLPTIVLYAAFALNWSSRQYVTHAYSKRHLIEGAFNLKASKMQSLIALKSEWELNHHRRPDVPWKSLPLVEIQIERSSYWHHYLMQWRGPKESVEPSPLFEEASKQAAVSVESRDPQPAQQ